MNFFEWRKLVNVGSRDERKRFFEIFAMFGVAILFVALSRLEGRLFDLSRSLSEHYEFLNSLVYFGLINVNVVLILVLSFLLFRNIVKLVIDRRRGVIGSRLRTKLVIALVFFALAPTALLFYISTRFLTESFETWFSSRVEATMHRTREAGAMVYDRDQRRLATLARQAVQKIEVSPAIPFSEQRSVLSMGRLRGFSRENRVSSVRVYGRQGEIIWPIDSDRAGQSGKEYRFINQTLSRFEQDAALRSRSVIETDEGRDVVRGVAPIIDQATENLLGVVVVEERFETKILQSVETIIQEFASLKPGAELIRLSYVILLVLMVVIIVFSAIWLGFYVARGIIAPIHSLAEATREVASGNYNVVLDVKSDDETGRLIQAFNGMTKDLRDHAKQVQNFTDQLERTNDELDRRREYMEVILRNISAGVISIDSEGKISSVNRSAERLLGIAAQDIIGKRLEVAIDKKIIEHFLNPILERVQFGPFSGEIDLTDAGKPLTLLADATRIVGDSNEDLGVVIVFDDASEQVKAQRVAAWREVARRIAHEIKNPLTPIKISAQRLLRKFGDQFSGKDHQVFVTCIETIISEVDALRDLVNEFSKFSRLPTIKSKPENMNIIVKDILGLFSMSYPLIEFNLSELSEDLPFALVDKEQMVRVITNVLKNSIDSIPDDRARGVISVRSKWIAEYQIVRVEFLDNGSGIPDHLKQRVLEPYFSTKKEGTGLGLAIVHQIISDHGGYLRIQDNSPYGTIIIIELPCDGSQFGKRSTDYV